MKQQKEEKTMETNNMRKYIDIAIILIVAIGSFFAGRATISPTSEVKYVKGDVIRDTVPLPVPYKEYYTKEVLVPMKKDTLWRDGEPVLTYMKVDTAAIIADYTLKREYEKVLFNNDEHGKMTVGVKLQYNKLQDNITYEYSPIKQQVTREKLLTPFVGIDYNSFGYVGIGGGLYYHNVGLEGKYVTDFNKKGFEVGIKYKF